MRAVLAAAAMLVAAAWAAPTALAQFSPGYEARNFSKTQERGRFEFNRPEYQQELRRRGALETAEGVAIKARDPERDFMQNLCWSHMDGCAGDVRLYDWEADGHGIVEPVLFTARNGATISGNVWATRSGPARRPGVVITNGSVQAPEELYWFAAQVLAKRGFVVLTFDPQGQGRSDTYGEGADRNEGVPAQAGRPFFDGTEDALDFFLSTPAKPYDPRDSCTTGTDHSAKHSRRIRQGFNAARNPLSGMLDRRRIGLAGHSFGAAGVSFVGQKDPRVDAVAAWDGLREPATEMTCASAPETRTPAPLRRPGLGFDADYGLPTLLPVPKTSEPSPNEKNSASKQLYSPAGVDTGELSIRGGTHFEWAYIPNQEFSATLRGMDLAAWYTAAWMELYVKGEPAGARRLLTGAWRNDQRGAEVDPDGDGNLFSRYYLSRLDIGRQAGPRFRCEDLRRGCAELRPSDCGARGYSYLAEIFTPDGRRPGADSAACPGALRPGTGDGTVGDCTIRGTSGNDVLRGTSGPDRICGGDGNDVIRGLGGADSLRGEGGNDQLRGDAGNDALTGGPGNDGLGGDEGADRLAGDAGRDTHAGHAGGDGIDSRDGVEGNDLTQGGPGNDRCVLDDDDRESSC